MFQSLNSEGSVSDTRIAVLLSGLSYDSQRRFVGGMLEAAKADGTDLFFFVCDAEDYQARTVYETGEFNIYSLPDFSLFDAIIGYFDTIHDVDVVSEIIDRIRRSGKPCVSVNTYVEDFICLKLDNQTGLRDILDHLYEKHKVRSICYISGASDNTDATERLQTVRAFLRERNIPFPKDNIYYGNYTYPSGYRSMDALIRSGRPLPDAVVCANDSYATEDGTYYEKDASGRITEVLFHLNQPRGYRGLEIFVLSTDLLRKLVAECEAHDQYSFRRNVLMEQCNELNLQMYTWTGFAAQIRSVQEYYERSMQLLNPEIRAELFPKDRPIRAKGADKSSTYISESGSCLNSLVAEGCSIEGTVVDSILFPGVTVAKGAVVRNSILFKGTSVGENANLAHVIADKDVEIKDGRTLMGHFTYPIVLAKKSIV